MKRLVFVLPLFLLAMSLPTVQGVATIELRSPEHNVNIDNVPVDFEFLAVDNASASFPCFLLIDRKRVAEQDVQNNTLWTIPFPLDYGTHAWAIACADSQNNNSTSVSRAINVEERCSILASGLLASNNTIYLTLENTGTKGTGIDYFMNVDFGRVVKNRVVLGVGEKRQVNHQYQFGLTNYNIEANSTADCGASDYLTIQYSKTKNIPDTCTGPFGYHGQVTCDTINRQLVKCSDGIWNEYTKDSSFYCSQCGHCGDSVQNCGEALTTCPQDFGLAIDCRCHERAVLIENMTKTGPEFFNACRDNCSLQCFTDFDCQGVHCKDFSCSGIPTNCSVQITEFDYLKQFASVDQSYAIAKIRNTGGIRETVNSTLFVDSDTPAAYSVLLNPAEEKIATFIYRADIGQHSIRLVSKASCGAKDEEAATVNVFRSSTTSVAESGRDVSSMDFSTNNISGTVEADSLLSFTLRTNRPQVFTLKVSGVPSDWLRYSEMVGVADEKNVQVIVRPKEQGVFDIKVDIQGNTQKFSAAANLTVFPKQPKKQMGNQTAIVMILAVVVLFSLAIFIGTKRLKY